MAQSSVAGCGARVLAHGSEGIGVHVLHDPADRWKADRVFDHGFD
jgi:hypothetical protein